MGKLANFTNHPIKLVHFQNNMFGLKSGINESKTALQPVFLFFSSHLLLNVVVVVVFSSNRSMFSQSSEMNEENEMLIDKKGKQSDLYLYVCFSSSFIFLIFLRSIYCMASKFQFSFKLFRVCHLQLKQNK